MKRLFLVLPSGRYEITDTLRRPSMNRLLELKKETGIGMRTIVEGLNRRDRVVKETVARLAERVEAGEEVEDLRVAVSAELSEDTQVVEALRAFVWLARREAGETVTVEEAGAFNPADFRVLAEDEQDQVAADPTTPATDSAPAAGQQPGAAAQAS